MEALLASIVVDIILPGVHITNITIKLYFYKHYNNNNKRYIMEYLKTHTKSKYK